MSNFNFSKQPNSFFRYQEGYDNEKFLYSMLSTEQILHQGIKVKYFAVGYNKDHDRFYGEDERPITYPNDDNSGNTEFAFTLKMMPSDLPKEDETWSAFGQEGTDSFKLYCTTEHFRQVSNAYIATRPELATSGYEYIPHIGDLIKMEYNDFFLEVTFVNNSISDHKFHQFRGHGYEFSVRKMVIDSSLESVSSDFVELKEMFDFNINKLDISDEIDLLKNGVQPTGTTNPETNFPEASGKGKPKILFTPEDGEKKPNFEGEGW